MRGPKRASPAGSYTWVPPKLAHACPACEAPRGRRCVKKQGDQFLPMAKTHKERRAMRSNHR